MAESKYITEEDYFICSDGIMPARLKSKQELTKQKNKNNYITVDHTSTHSFGDFVCRWAMVLAAAIATLVVLSGGAALSLLLVAGVAAAGAAGGALLCGHFMAAGRKWDESPQLYIIAGFHTVDAKLMMHCKIGGMIRVAPGCNSFWKACVIGAKNFVFAGLEGIAVGATIYYGGRMIASGSFSRFLPNLAKNYGNTWTKPLGLVGRGIGALNKAFDNYFVEGMEGIEAWEESWKGAFVVEIPLYNVINNALDSEKSNRWQDYYYAALTVGSLGLIPPHKFEEANTKFVQSIKKLTAKLGRFFGWVKEKPLIEQLRDLGLKFTEENILRIEKTSNGKIVFLEEGNSRAGWRHILKHLEDFKTAGYPIENLQSIIFEALKQDNIVGYQGAGTGRPIYQVTYGVQTYYIAITVGDNGFIVGANPSSKP